MHPAIPRDLTPTTCPELALRDPRVEPLLTLFFRARRYGVLPRAGGLDAQDERDLRAFDAMSHALTLPHPSLEMPAR